MIVLRTGAGMDYDQEKVDEIVLALLWLTAFDVDESGGRTWKSHDWDVLDRLHAKGYISDPKSKAKSVVLGAEGVKRARRAIRAAFWAQAHAELRVDTIPKAWRLRPRCEPTARRLYPNAGRRRNLRNFYPW